MLDSAEKHLEQHSKGFTEKFKEAMESLDRHNANVDKVNGGSKTPTVEELESEKNRIGENIGNLMLDASEVAAQISDGQYNVVLDCCPKELVL